MARDGAISIGGLYFEAGIATRGSVRIPVCGFAVGLRNWQSYKNSGEKPAGYPRNK